MSGHVRGGERGLQTLELARREILTDQDKAEAIRKLFAACVE